MKKLCILAILLCSSFATLHAENIMDSVAGTGKAADSPASGKASEINIGQPFGVEIGPDGALYICEVQNHRLRKLDFKTQTITTIAGTGKKGYSGDGALATAAEINEPYEVRFDSQGNILFVEMKNHIIRKIHAKTGIISTVAGTGVAGFSGDGGPATQATFSQPHSIALDAQDNIYVADILNHRIRKIDAKTGIITSIAGNEKKALPREGQLAKDQPVLGPRSLFVHDNDLWVCLREGNSIWKLSLPVGKWQHIAGNGKKGNTGDGASAREATMNGPKGIALGKNHMVYVVDTENQTIRGIDLKSGLISTVAGAGPNFKGDVGNSKPATQARLARPHGVCVGSDGAIYIGDSENHLVRRVRSE